MPAPIPQTGGTVPGIAPAFRKVAGDSPASSRGPVAVDRRRAAGWILLLPILAALSADSQPGPPTAPAPLGPDEFRAALLSKIPRFVTWPESALGPADTEVVIALLEIDSFRPLLEALLKDVRVADRPVTVRVLATLDDLPRCQILFVPGSRTDALAQLPAGRRAGLLTIGEDPRFTRQGGICNLSLGDRKLTVNIRNARTAGLELQSRLLRISEVER